MTRGSCRLTPIRPTITASGFTCANTNRITMARSPGSRGGCPAELARRAPRPGTLRRDNGFRLRAGEDLLEARMSPERVPEPTPFQVRERDIVDRASEQFARNCEQVLQEI